ncbi:MAG: aldo/keto reductase [Chloroflexi bacterium]|nr:aldo/keto reductase [Chloroflexota bacterium]MCC6895160.1 aldo/keto reductase [Anaerolineae bacterium]
METRQLGNSDLQITPIGYGAWAIGGAGWEAAWGEQDDGEAIEAIQAAIDGGINWIDTAAVYGLGHSEELVAKALKGRANKPYIFTKSSKLWTEDRKVYSSLKSVRKEIEDSLRRLQTDVVDLYQIHWPNPDDEIEEGWAEMAKLKAEGKVRWIGVSNFNVSQMERAAKIAPITSLQPPYSLVERKVEAETLPYCEQHNIGVIAYSPMGAGLLTGAMTLERARNLPADDWRSRSENFREPRLTRHLQLVDILKAIGEKHGRTAGEVAIAWTLRLPAVTGAIVGARSAKQVEGIIGGLEFRLSADEIEQIEAFCRTNP